MLSLLPSSYYQHLIMVVSLEMSHGKAKGSSLVIKACKQ
jgi:hypothetical protein